MQKRPSFKLPPEVVQRAIELRREGRTIRAIGDELGVSKSAIHETLRNAAVDFLLAAATAEDIERATDLEQVVREMILVVRGMVRDLGQRLRGASASTVKAADMNAATRMIVELQRLASLLKGRATARTEHVQSGRVTVEHSPAETEALDALDAWKQGQLEDAKEVQHGS
jgi:hypothetical protein